MSPHTRLIAVTLTFGLLLSCVWGDGESDRFECHSNSDCAADEYCGELRSTGCGGQGGSCLPRLEQGERCAATPFPSCAEGLVCHLAFGDEDGFGKCQPPSVLGGPCRATGDCGTDPARPAHGAPVCDRSSSTCAAPFTVDEGVACDDRRACEPHLACVADETYAGSCRGPGGVGASCNGLWLDGMQRACADGLRCVQSEGQWRCAEPGEVGASCRLFEDCAEGLFCLAGVDGGTICQAPRGAGEPCIPGLCADGLACLLDDESGASSCGTPRGAGEECGGLDCAAGLTCQHDAAAGGDVCGPPRGIGEPCTLLECGDGLACVGGTCIEPGPPRGEGEACGAGALCAEGLRCRRETCVAPGGVSDLCNADSDCERGLGCIGSACTP